MHRSSEDHKGSEQGEDIVADDDRVNRIIPGAIVAATWVTRTGSECRLAGDRMERHGAGDGQVGRDFGRLGPRNEATSRGPSGTKPDLR